MLASELQFRFHGEETATTLNLAAAHYLHLTYRGFGPVHRFKTSSSAIKTTHATSALVFVGLWIGLTGLISGCSNAPHIDSEVAHSYRTSVPIGPVGRGWNRVWVGRLVDKPQLIQHKIQVQADLAGDLVRMSPRERRKIVGTRVCPGADHEIWQQLHSGHDIQVELATKKNGPFRVVSCRRAVL